VPRAKRFDCCTQSNGNARAIHQRQTRQAGADKGALQNSQQFGQPARNTPKSIHSQFGHNYDIKKAGNTSPTETALSGNTRWLVLKRALRFRRDIIPRSESTSIVAAAIIWTLSIYSSSHQSSVPSGRLSLPSSSGTTRLRVRDRTPSTIHVVV